MKNGLRRWWLGLALLAVAALYPLARDAQGPRGPAPLPAQADQPATAPSSVLAPADRQAFPPRSLPSDTLGLAALTEAAQTTFLAIRRDGTAEPLAGPLVADAQTALMRGRVLAFLVLPGLDPAGNYIEVHDFGRSAAWQVRPEEASAIFGFALDPSGRRLAYLEVDVRVVGAAVPWRVVAVDLIDGTKEAILDSAGRGAVALLPYAWSSEAILFRGLTPFGNRYHGLWASRPDGSDLREIAAEADYVGWPRLDPRPEGGRLALLVSSPSGRPAAYGPGEPPANAIRVLDLRDGHAALGSAPVSGRGWAAVEWTDGGLAALAGEWDAGRNRFAYRSVVLFEFGPAMPPRLLFSSPEGEVTHLTACPDGSWLAAIRSGEQTQLVGAGQAAPLALAAGPALDWLACLG